MSEVLPADVEPQGHAPPVRAVVALAGRLVDACDADEARFPLGKADIVRRRLRILLEDAGAKVLVASAAAGADLLAHDVAAELGLVREVVLPFPVERFRVTSVASRAGPWPQLFARLVETPAVGLSVTILAPQVGDPYDAANQVILEHARAYIESEGLKPVAVLVWEGHSHGSGDSTADFCRQAAEMGFQILETPTL